MLKLKLLHDIVSKIRYNAVSLVIYSAGYGLRPRQYFMYQLKSKYNYTIVYEVQKTVA